MKPYTKPHASDAVSGFTLVELSIVLVIIGLLIGGVLVGRDLIESAAIRAQVQQIQEFNTATYTFKTKYNCLPGDCLNAAPLGLFSSGMDGTTGKGDGNGVLQDYHLSTTCPYIVGEELVYWRHLSETGLIKASLGNTLVSGGAVATDALTIDQVAQVLPISKINNAIAIAAYGVGSENYYELWYPLPRAPALPYMIQTTGNYSHTAGVTPIQAAAIDTKIDNGAPLTGFVQAKTGFWTSCFGWTPVFGGTWGCTTASGTYDLTHNDGSNNCEVNFHFQ